MRFRSSCSQKRFLLSLDAEGCGTGGASWRWYYAGRRRASRARISALGSSNEASESMSSEGISRHLLFPRSSVRRRERDRTAIHRPALNYSLPKAEYSQRLFQKENLINAACDWQQTDVSGWVMSCLSRLHDSLMLRIIVYKYLSLSFAPLLNVERFFLVVVVVVFFYLFCGSFSSLETYHLKLWVNILR